LVQSIQKNIRQYKQIPFRLKAVESTGGSFFDGLFDGKEISVGELLRHRSVLRLRYKK